MKNIKQLLLISLFITQFLSACAQPTNKKDTLIRVQHSGGLVMPTELEFSETPFSLKGAFEKFDGNLPEQIDLSAYVPPPGDQGILPTCVPWVLAYNLRSAQQKSISQWDYNIVNGNPSTERVFSPSYIYNLVAKNSSGSNCPKGMSFESAFKIASTRGFSFWKDFTYDGNINNCQINPLQYVNYGSTYANVGYERISSTVDNIKSYLANGYLVVLGIKLDKKFEKDGFNAFGTGQPYVYSFNGEVYDYHAVLCVGYNESTKRLKIVNSYGQNWGDNGYFYISYSDVKNIIRLSYIGWVSSINNQIKIEALNPQVSGDLIKNNKLIESFEPAIPKKVDDFQLVNQGYDSLSHFTVFTLIRKGNSPINFTLRKNETKIVNLNKSTALQFSLADTEEITIRNQVNVGILKLDYKSDSLSNTLKFNLIKDMNEIPKNKPFSTKQKEIVDRIKEF